MERSTMEHTNKGISGFTLKLIATATMLIDHIGAVILGDMIDTFGPVYPWLIPLYYTFRVIGRLSFPTFAFLLVEGFTHTSSVKRYALNLALFALISEIPINLAARSKVFAPDYQNTFFTLLLGLLCIWVIREFAESRCFGEEMWIQTVITMASVAGFCAIARFLKSDYDMWGVAVIAALYILRYRRIPAFAFACLLLTIMDFIEVSSFLMVIPVAFYNGKRGSRINKYIFYVIYPLHLTVFYLIAYMLGFTTFAIR